MVACDPHRTDHIVAWLWYFQRYWT